MPSPTRLVDTVVFVDYLRGNPAAKNWLDAFPADELAVSVVTGAELLAGARNQHEQQQIQKDLAAFPMVWISEPISKRAWRWYRQFHLSHGRFLGDYLVHLERETFSTLPGFAG